VGCVEKNINGEKNSVVVIIKESLNAPDKHVMAEKSARRCGHFSFVEE